MKPKTAPQEAWEKLKPWEVMTDSKLIRRGSKLTRCRHSESWIIAGGRVEWCTSCGSFRTLKRIPDGPENAVGANSVWCRPGTRFQTWQEMSLAMLKKRRERARTTRKQMNLDTYGAENRKQW